MKNRKPKLILLTANNQEFLAFPDRKSYIERIDKEIAFCKASEKHFTHVYWRKHRINVFASPSAANSDLPMLLSKLPKVWEFQHAE